VTQTSIKGKGFQFYTLTFGGVVVGVV